MGDDTIFPVSGQVISILTYRFRAILIVTNTVVFF